MNNSEYNTLLNKYNRLIAQYKDLEEIHKTKTQQWEDKFNYTNTVYDAIRSLCEDILAKNKDEMVLGTEYSWSSVEIKELIQKAINSYKKYNKMKTELAAKLFDIAEDRRQQIESLQDQISQMLINGNQLPTETKQEREEKEEAIKKMPFKTQEAINSGAIEAIVVENSDITPDDFGQELAAIEKLNNSLESSVQVPISDQRKKINNFTKNNNKNNKVNAYVINIDDYKEKVTDLGWSIIDIMGSEGINQFTLIEQKAIEKGVELKSKVRMTITSLEALGFVEKSVISTPIKSKITLYRLTLLGSRIFKEKFNKTPVICEMDTIETEHDNLEHGYGILDIKNVLDLCPRYKSVSIMNRKNPITLKDGLKYIADVIAVTDKYTEYMEYERGNTNYTDFVAKCNKMTQVTNFVNFIAPNKEIMTNKIIACLLKWIDNRSPVALKGVRIRVTTAKYIKEHVESGANIWQAEINVATKEVNFKD